MSEDTRVAPVGTLRAQVSEEPCAGGRMLTYTCQPAHPLTGGGFHRLYGLRVRGRCERAFASGFSYDAMRTIGPPQELPFPYNTYRRVKWPAREVDGVLYHAAADLKLPLLAVHCIDADEWCGIAFDPVVRIGAYTVPLFFALEYDGNGAQLHIGFFARATLRVDRHPWFGLGRSTRHVYGPAGAGLRFDVRVVELAAADWPRLVRHACTSPLLPALPPAPADPPNPLTDAMDRAWHFLGRAEDNAHGALVHLFRRGGPGQVSQEFKHSHVTPELHALALSATLAAQDGDEAAVRRGRLKHWCGQAERRTHQGDAMWWHTTTRIGANGLTAFTHHGAGFVGFPGGQATNARHLAEAYHATGDDEFADMALATARWVRQRQRDDGAWPATVHVPGDVRLKPVGAGEPCVAATAESVRALLAAYQIESDRAWLDAADAGLAFVNAEDACFRAQGYLRDTAPTEPEGMTAECAIHANLDRARFGPAEAFVAHAERWAWYGAQWTRPLALDPRGAWMADAVGHTITPRIDTWSALLLGAAWARLADVTGDAFWRQLAWRQLDGCVALQEPDGGFAETWWYEWPDGLTPVPIESTFLAPAFLDLARAFAPAWTPPAFAQGKAATVLPGMHADGPDGLSLEFYEIAHRPRLAALHERLLRQAREGGPRSVAARVLAAWRLLTGGEAPLVEQPATVPHRIIVRHEPGQQTANAWDWRFALSCPPSDETIIVPRLYVRGGRSLWTEGDTLVLESHEGICWKFTVDAPGNVLVNRDGTIRFECATNWQAGVREFPVHLRCVRTGVAASETAPAGAAPPGAPI